MRNGHDDEPTLMQDAAEGGARPVPKSAVALSTRLILAPLSRLLKRTGTGDTLCVVVVPPGADWCEPVARALADSLQDRAKPRDEDRVPTVLTRTAASARATTRDDERRSVAVDLSRGCSVFGVSHRPDTCLPDVLMRAADEVVTLAPLSGRQLRRVIREATGEDPGRVSDDLAAAIAVDDIATCIRPGATAPVTLARLEAARRARTRTREVEAPPLETLAGYGEAKEWGLRLAREVGRYRAGRIRLEDLPRGLLLSGPPGTGKTLFAQALARSCGLPIVATSAARWLSSGDGHLDHVIKAMRADFDAALAMRPSIVFLDEADAIVDPTREESAHRSWWMSFRAALLSTIDGATSAPGIVLIGACNHPDMIDAALRRAGRLDRHISIELPDRDALVQILEVQLAGDLAGADLCPLADLALGSSGADVARAVRDARARARDAERPLALADLSAALALDPLFEGEDLRLVALHEAGHAVIARLLGHTVGSVSIVRSAGAHGRASVELPRRLTRAALHGVVLVALAGRAADEVLGRGPCAGSSTDLATATRLLARLEGAYGLGERLLSVEEDHVDRLLPLDAGLRDAVSRQLDLLWRHVVELVRANAPAIEAVATALVADRVIGEARLRALVDAHGEKPPSPLPSA
ncbi:AAA family ATPase [Salinarimonas ramus]|uniref:AAA+ ATPase domain-containing protein n=1 Tax=Salinarimonas ramus TaxID=690164 RepID=A0A917QFP6_9HYPH|nr:AAA family ATPase [Salinarimonas ramus]GGK47695.1 hypothetical protein GCM10011322_38430 [Salinarimonas ramus]